ncbi:hypothetical protein [Parapedobacter soli]|uniref:hypothetical protein n=1 Tax=Parapedobacter soli TaxID=416955 RepID=UPI0021C93BFD|nr:hypothetical protein [Parapedobacter soli]
MILSFSQKWPASMGEWAGEPNYFIYKIWEHLFDQVDFKEFAACASDHLLRFGNHWDIPVDTVKPKLHTIRHDPHDRWKPGMKIHPVINNRTKNYFQFAPEFLCVSTQQVDIIDSAYTKDYAGISIEYSHRHKDGGVEEYVKHWEVVVDGVSLKSTQIEELAVNDGFDSVEQFFTWFNAPMRYKLIHWTSMRY